MSDVSDIHSTRSQSYGDDLSTDLREALDGFVSTVDQDDLDDVVSGSHLIETFGDSQQERIHRRLAEFKLTEHNVIGYLDEVVVEDDGGQEDLFAPTFLEVSRYYE